MNDSIELYELEEDLAGVKIDVLIFQESILNLVKSPDNCFGLDLDRVTREVKILDKLLRKEAKIFMRIQKTTCEALV
jgi:hypothetical protein